MSPRRALRALTLLVTALALSLPVTAYAQPDIPPPLKTIRNGKPWTYKMGDGLLAIALVFLAGIVLGYLVKARQFRANQRRGGSK